MVLHNTHTHAQTHTSEYKWVNINNSLKLYVSLQYDLNKISATKCGNDYEHEQWSQITGDKSCPKFYRYLNLKFLSLIS